MSAWDQNAAIYAALAAARDHLLRERGWDVAEQGLAGSQPFGVPINLIPRINRSGEAMFGGVTWNGRRAMRVSVVNWRTSAADVDRTLTAVAHAIAG
jgi:hypothetical protein